MHSIAYSVGPLLFIVFAFCFMIAIVYLSFTWERSRSNSLIEQWATANGYELLTASRDYWKLFTPFWATAKGQTVYRVAMRDQYGEIYKGYALCGGRFMGLWSDRVEVKFDTPPYEKHKYTGEKLKNDFEKPKNDTGYNY